MVVSSERNSEIGGGRVRTEGWRAMERMGGREGVEREQVEGN